MFTPLWDGVFYMVLLITVFVVVFSSFFKWIDGEWKRRHTYQLVLLTLALTFSVASYKQCTEWHSRSRAWNFAQLLSRVPIERHQPVSATKLSPGKLWFGGAFAPRGFEHGQAWCSGAKTEGYEIFTFALEKPAVVYVDVYNDDVLDAVYPAEIRKGFFPSISKGSAPQKPTQEEQVAYAELVAKLRKPALVEAAQNEFGRGMFPR